MYCEKRLVRLSDYGHSKSTILHIPRHWMYVSVCVCVCVCMVAASVNRDQDQRCTKDTLVREHYTATTLLLLEHGVI